MKSKTTTAAAVKSMKASKKQIASRQFTDAIKGKLEEIKNDHHNYKANPASLALFGYNTFNVYQAMPTQTKSRQPQGSPALTSHQLVLF